MEGASSGIIPEYSVHILSDGGVSAHYGKSNQNE